MTPRRMPGTRARTEDGDVLIFEHGKTKKLLETNNMENSVYTTPVASNDVLYITNRRMLFAIQAGQGEKTAASK